MSFDRALAGLAMGVGKGLVAEAEARRAESLERLRREFMTAEADKQRGFQAQQSDLDRAQRMELAKMQEEGADRRSRRSAGGQGGITSTVVGEDGTVYGMGRDGTLRPITTPDGQPFRQPQRGDPRIYAETLEALNSDPNWMNRSAEDRIAYARRTANYPEPATGQGGGSGGASTPAPAASAPPVGTTLNVDGQRMRFTGGDPSKQESWEVVGGTPRRETPAPAAPTEAPAAPARGFGVTEEPAPERPARPSPGRGGTRSGERPTPGMQPDQIDAAREQVVRNVVSQTGGVDRWMTPDGQVKPEAQAQIEQMAANLQITPEQFVELLRTIAEEQ